MNEAMAKALIAVQSEMDSLPKNKTGYGYKYTDFDTLVSSFKPVLKKNGLGFSQLLKTRENGRTCIETIVFHESGEAFSASVDVPIMQLGKMTDAQCLGAGITYMKRYALSAVFGISSDEDTDGTIPQQQQHAGAGSSSGYGNQPPQNGNYGGYRR